MATSFSSSSSSSSFSSSSSLLTKPYISQSPIKFTNLTNLRPNPSPILCVMSNPSTNLTGRDRCTHTSVGHATIIRTSYNIRKAIQDWVTNVETTHYILVTRKTRLLKNGGGTSQMCWLPCVGGRFLIHVLFHEFVDDKDVRLIGVEAAGFGLDSGKHAATLTKGEVGVLHGTNELIETR
ncbi:tryptophan synthase beta chain 2, chloroplastic [Tanacetum coccineum]|uniref:Tryptophan synthase beta chain 2, chloroplastic n=1 Tax=Tanacetum coccineum TaxID=301880 RepID=A0ABQ5A1Q6_9ASTR